VLRTIPLFAVWKQFNKAVYATRHMELRIAIRDGLLDQKTHRVMKMMASYVSAVYGITPDGMDLEGALFQTDAELCRKIVKDVKSRFRRYLKYVEVECLEY
jgi:aromatic ring hydroxylase